MSFRSDHVHSFPQPLQEETTDGSDFGLVPDVNSYGWGMPQRYFTVCRSVIKAMMSDLIVKQGKPVRIPLRHVTQRLQRSLSSTSKMENPTQRYVYMPPVIFCFIVALANMGPLHSYGWELILPFPPKMSRRRNPFWSLCKRTMRLCPLRWSSIMGKSYRFSSRCFLSARP